MKLRVVVVLGVTLFATACGSSPKPAAEPAAPAASPASPAPAAAAAPPAPVETAAAAPAPAPAPTPAPAAKPAEVTTSVTAVSNEVVTPNVVSPDKVISELRPKLNACYQDGLKKDPKLAGSVTLSAKIEKDGKVSAVNPKLLEGLSPAVVKCLTEKVKAANFAPSGGMNYTTSIDIPVRFASN